MAELKTKRFSTQYLTEKGLPWKGFVDESCVDQSGDSKIVRLIFEDGNTFWQIEVLYSDGFNSLSGVDGAKAEWVNATAMVAYRIKTMVWKPVFLVPGIS